MKPDLTPVDVESALASAPTPSLTILTPAVEPLTWPKKKEDGKPFKLKLPPEKVWEYRLADGALYGVVARWDRKDGKVVLPCVYVRDDEGNERWAWSGFGTNEGQRPLLGLIELATKPMATVLVVEGEKTKDAAPKWMPADWVCVTWQGGSNAVKYANWTPLAARRVVIWPDKDAAPIDPKTGQVALDPKTKKAKLPAGENTARELLVLLNGLGASVALVPVYGAMMNMLPSNGWDLADDPPDGFNPTEWMVKAASFLAAPVARNIPAPATPGPVANGADTEEPPAPDLTGEPPPEDADGRDGLGAEFRCVGYTREDGKPKFHIFSARSGFIVEQMGKEIQTRSGVMNVVPSEPYWRETIPWLRDVEKVPWHKVGEMLIQQCYAAGFFKRGSERGRGAWFDDGRVVMHLGEVLIVDGQPTSPVKMKSEFYYPVSEPLFAVKGEPALTDDEGRLIRKICRTIKWDNPLHSEMLAGWIGTAPVCGAMPWRTHFWLQGGRGAGKTMVVEQFIKPLMGGLAFYPIGNSTAAGILGELALDARPVVYDEAEAKGDEGIKRRAFLIEMLRYSSSQSSSVVVKGSAGHKSISFRVQSQYFLASIGAALTDGADQTRTLICPIRPKGASDPSFGEFDRLVAQLPPNVHERLLRRQLKNLRTIRANADTLARIMGARLDDRRLGDQIGTLMAGDYSLTTDRRLDDATAEELVDARLSQGRLDDYVRVNERKEDTDLMEHLVSYVVRVGTRNGYTVDRSFGELMGCAAGRVSDPADKVDMAEADVALRRLGISYERINDVAGFWIAKQKTYVANEVMKRSQFAQGWDLVLKNHRRAIQSDRQRSFGGFKLHAVWLPYDVLMGEEVISPDQPTEE